MANALEIVMIGAGNVAVHLAGAFVKAGHTLKAIYSRRQERAQELAGHLGSALAVDNLDFTGIPADVYVVSVTDDALPAVLGQAQFPAGSLVVHTSGTHSLQVFDANAGIRGGVFYPLQTFSAAKAVDFAVIPVCVEASAAADLKLLQELAGSISKVVVQMSTRERKQLHIAAVFACNFTNHLFGISFDLMQKAGLDPALLHPLIRETVDKALTHPPFEVQTGPAARNDETIIKEHVQLLMETPVYRQIYALISESIIRQKS